MKDNFGLYESWQKLRHKWEQTKTAWDDPVSREFEHNFFIPLSEQEERTLMKLEKLTHVIENARRNIKKPI